VLYLPAGYRIAGGELRFSVVSWDAWAQVQVTSAGYVIPRSGSNGWHNVNLSFRRNSRLGHQTSHDKTPCNHFALSRTRTATVRPGPILF